MAKTLFVVEIRGISGHVHERWRPVARFSMRSKAEEFAAPLLNPAWPETVRIVESQETIMDLPGFCYSGRDWKAALR